LSGELSKVKAEAVLKSHGCFHADILHSFEMLEEKGFIYGSRFRKPHLGRPERYYRITTDGLKALIADDPTPENFWKVLLGFCHHNEEIVSLSKVDELYKFFIDKYLEYSSVYGYSFQIDSFNNVCEKWINKNVLKHDVIVTDQKVLEALALLEPPVTLDILSKKIGESVDDIEKILSKYIPVPHKPLLIPAEGFTKNYFKTHKIYNTESPGDFLLRYTVVVKKGLKDNILLQLSLFGIILVLTLVRYNDMGRLKHGLYFSNITYEQYYDQIASNYKNKLPLIFGKWYLLKQILKVFAAYNFDTILDKETRSRSMDKLLLAGGKKELYDSNRAIGLHTQKQIGELQVKGLEILLNYMSNPARYVLLSENNMRADNDNLTKIEALYAKLHEITTLLSSPLKYDPTSYIEMLTQGSIDKSTATQLSRFYEIDNIDELFGNEITSLYYLSMFNENTFQVIHPTNYYNGLMSKAKSNLKQKSLSINDKELDHLQKQKQKEEDRYSIMPDSLGLPPKERLVSILESDDTIREWFSKWLGDLLNYQNKTMNIIYDEIKKLKAN
jgi:hypothetical protein